MLINMPIEFVVCSLAEALTTGELETIPVETLIALNNAIEQELELIRTIH